jgi:hypothetical protein
MSEIEIGEYVRTEYGISKLIEIRKVDGCEEQKIYIFDDISDELWSGDLPNELWKSEIEWHEEKFNNKIFLKHSKQLIDLIEVGDYVNGREVKHIAMFEGFPDYPKLIFVDETHLIPDDTCENDEIQTILTKEIYMANCYKVGGEDE